MKCFVFLSQTLSSDEDTAFDKLLILRVLLDSRMVRRPKKVMQRLDIMPQNIFRIEQWCYKNNSNSSFKTIQIMIISLFEKYLTFQKDHTGLWPLGTDS